MVLRCLLLWAIRWNCDDGDDTLMMPDADCYCWWYIEGDWRPSLLMLKEWNCCYLLPIRVDVPIRGILLLMVMVLLFCGVVTEFLLWYVTMPVLLLFAMILRLGCYTDVDWKLLLTAWFSIGEGGDDCYYSFDSFDTCWWYDWRYLLIDDVCSVMKHGDHLLFFLFILTMEILLSDTIEVVEEYDDTLVKWLLLIRCHCCYDDTIPTLFCLMLMPYIRSVIDVDRFCYYVTCHLLLCCYYLVVRAWKHSIVCWCPLFIVVVRAERKNLLPGMLGIYCIAAILLVLSLIHSLFVVRWWYAFDRSDVRLLLIPVFRQCYIGNPCLLICNCCWKVMHCNTFLPDIAIAVVQLPSVTLFEEKWWWLLFLFIAVKFVVYWWYDGEVFLLLFRWCRCCCSLFWCALYCSPLWYCCCSVIYSAMLIACGVYGDDTLMFVVPVRCGCVLLFCCRVYPFYNVRW